VLSCSEFTEQSGATWLRLLRGHRRANRGFIASKIKAERKLPSFINVPLGMMGAIVGTCLFDGVQITDLRR